MKQLQLELNKRLLIVEMTGELDTVNVFYWNNQPVEKICKGDELTEDIAKRLVESKLSGTVLGELITKIKGEKVTIYKNYQSDKWCYTALKSFISAIESSGWHWGENPEGKPIYSVVNYGVRPGAYSRYVSDLKDWESRTFNPEKTLIFEIL